MLSLSRMRISLLLAVTLLGIQSAMVAASHPVVDVAYAGSLVTMMERFLGPAFAKSGYEFRGEGKGSVALGRLIGDGLRNPDIFISADTAVLDDLRAGPEAPVKWYLPFASARLVIGYSPKSRFARSLREAALRRRTIVTVLEQAGLRIGRTDPAIDPKGYRTVIAVRLAQQYYHEPDLQKKVLGDQNNPAQIFPEEQLLVRLESGDLDAAFLYSTESAARRIPTIELPAPINLGDVRLARRYARVVVRVGEKVRVGTPIVYALTIPQRASNRQGAVAFLRFFFSTTGKRIGEHSGLQFIRAPFVGDRTAVPQALSF
ncbi:MAG: extracellular solute-binding protein [Candidatus Eremiobacteraeota bacterium]|nr:extracellular solute-binding protein [Candidatus Eremiobacteraeota bacterium]